MKRLALVAICMALAAPAHAQIGSIVTRGVKTAGKVKDLSVSEEDERKIGANVSERVRQKYGVVQDTDVHRYVALVGALLTGASTRPGLAWQFIVLDTDGVNAFAAPGGFVHITRGALGLISSEAELAGVLGHEVIHVTEQHTINAIKKNAWKDIGADFAPSAGGALGQAVIDKLSDVAADMVMQGFGRAEELESDEKGIGLADKAGYSPAGLTTFLMKLQERNKAASQKQGLFASHPEMKERLDKMARQITAQKLSASVTLEDRYTAHISYTAKPQSEIVTVEAGSAGLVEGSAAPADKGEKSDEKDTKAADKEEQPKKRGFGLSRLVKGGGEEKKSAEVVGAGGSRGVDTERNAKGGGNPALVAVSLTPAEIQAFKTEGKLG